MSVVPRLHAVNGDEPSLSGAGGRRSVSTYEGLRLASLEEIARTQTDSRKPEAVMMLVREVVERYQYSAERGSGVRLTNPGEVVDRLVRSLTGAGPLEKYFRNPNLASDLVVKGDTISFVTPDGRQGIDPEPTCEAELVAMIQRLLADEGATVDLEHPLVVRMIWANRVRLSVSIPPVADCLDAAVRIYRRHRTDLNELVELDSMSRPAANVLAACQLTPTAVVLTGSPGSGKSTNLNAQMLATPATTNTRIVQDVRELDAPHLPGGRWSPDAVGVSMRMLILRAMQFNPQLLVVGETRGEESFELLKAANAGCGLLTTLHANSAQLGMQSLVTAALMAGENVPERVVRTSFARLIDIVVHCEAEPLHRIPAGGRRRRQVMEICAVPAQISHDEFVLEPIFRREDFGRPLEFVGHQFPADFERRIDRALPSGIRLRDLADGSAVIL